MSGWVGRWVGWWVSEWMGGCHGNIATEGSPKPGLCPTLISNDIKGSL